MTTLAQNAPRTFGFGDELSDIPAVAADTIYDGSAVGDNASGYGRPLVAGDPFRGFCIELCDNSAGTAGAKRVKLRQKGEVELAISGLAITDVGKAVYASDDDTFTLTPSTNSYVGRVKRWISTGVGMVAFDATRGDLAAIGALTDNSSGTASDTIAVISDAATKNAIASLAAKVNQLAAMLA